MMVIYHDVGGAHSTCVAANIHIGKLPMDRVPSTKELISLPTFDKITKDELGHLIYIGEDEFNIKVYTLGRKYAPNIVIPALQDMYSILNKDNTELLIVDTKPTVNFLMNVGGFTSRKLHLVSIGRPIVLKGTQQAYMNIVNVVKSIKNNVNNVTRN